MDPNSAPVTVAFFVQKDEAFWLANDDLHVRRLRLRPWWNTDVMLAEDLLDFRRHLGLSDNRQLRRVLLLNSQPDTARPSVVPIQAKYGWVEARTELLTRWFGTEVVAVSAHQAVEKYHRTMRLRRQEGTRLGVISVEDAPNGRGGTMCLWVQGTHKKVVVQDGPRLTHNGKVVGEQIAAWLGRECDLCVIWQTHGPLPTAITLSNPHMIAPIKALHPNWCRNLSVYTTHDAVLNGALMLYA